MPTPLVLLVFVMVFAGCASTGHASNKEAWESARWERLTVAAEQARTQGNRGEAERLCIQAFQYVDTSTVHSLYEYAALLKALEREGAGAAHARAEKFREALAQPGSAYLGFVPSSELKQYADLLEELGRRPEAEAMRALAAAHDSKNMAQFFRQLEQAKGRDPRGICPTWVRVKPGSDSKYESSP